MTGDMTEIKVTPSELGSTPSKDYPDRLAVPKAEIGVPLEQTLPLPGGVRESEIKAQVSELSQLFKDPTSFQKYAELLTGGLKGEASVLTSFNSSFRIDDAIGEKSGIKRFGVFHESISAKITAELSEESSEKVTAFLDNLADAVRTALQDPESKLSATKIVNTTPNPEDYAQSVRIGTKEWMNDLLDEINAPEKLRKDVEDHLNFSLDKIFIEHNGFSKSILAKKIFQACKAHGHEMPQGFRDIIDSLASEIPPKVVSSKPEAAPTKKEVPAPKPEVRAATSSVIETAKVIHEERSQDYSVLKKAEQSICDRLNAEYKRVGRSGIPDIAREFIHETFRSIAEDPARFNGKVFEQEMRAGLKSNAIASTPKIDGLINDVVAIGMARKAAVQEAERRAEARIDAMHSARNDFRKPKNYNQALGEIRDHIDAGLKTGGLKDLAGNDKLYKEYHSCLSRLSDTITEHGTVAPAQLFRFIDDLSKSTGPERVGKSYTDFFGRLSELLQKTGVTAEMIPD